MILLAISVYENIALGHVEIITALGFASLDTSRPLVLYFQYTLVAVL